MTRFQEKFVLKVVYYVSAVGVVECLAIGKAVGAIPFGALMVVSLWMLLDHGAPPSHP